METPRIISVDDHVVEPPDLWTDRPVCVDPILGAWGILVNDGIDGLFRRISARREIECPTPVSSGQAHPRAARSAP